MTKISYSGYRFPTEIIQQAIWLYVRFTLSFRDVEDLLAKRGIVVSYETVRRWVNHFGPKIAADLRKSRCLKAGWKSKSGAASCIVVYHNCATSAASLRIQNPLRGLTRL